MKKLMYAFVAVFLSVFSYAQIEGKWKTIDDESGKEKSYVEIFKKADGKYYGKVTKLLIEPKDPNCSKCKDDRKGKPILGMEVIRGLSKDGNEFTGGTITNPKDGKSYKTEVVRDGNNLKVKAIVFGITVKTQVWQKVD